MTGEDRRDEKTRKIATVLYLVGSTRTLAVHSERLADHFLSPALLNCGILDIEESTMPLTARSKSLLTLDPASMST